MQTRSSVLGKRHASSEAMSSSSPPPTPSSSAKVDPGFLPTPDGTPSPKRIKMSATIHDGDNNKENIAPLRVEPINPLVLTPRSLRRNSTEYLSPSRRQLSLRRHNSLSHLPPATPATALSHLSFATPPPTPPSALRPISSRVRALLRPTCNGTARMAGRGNERTTITEFITSFLEETPRAVDHSILYISGAPGTGKTALVSTILDGMKEQLDTASVTVMTVNCMALNAMDALLERLIEEFKTEATTSKKSGRARKTKESPLQVLQNLFKAATHRCVLLLDELDHIASSSSSLTTLFNLIHSHGSTLRAIGIANTHTLSSTSVATSLSALSLTGVQTLHFSPYSPQQLFEIVQTRLAPLQGDLGAELAKFLPIPTLNLLTKKVAALTGDVRAVLEVLRGAIDIAVNTTSSVDPTGNPLNVAAPSVTPAHVLAALKAYTPATTPSRPTASGTVSPAAASRKASDSEVIIKTRELGLQSRLALLSLLLARHRLDSNLPLSGSPSVSPTATPRTPTKRTQSSTSIFSPSAGIDVGMLYTYYKNVLSRSEDGVFAPVSRSEFGDLLGMLETVGLIQLLLTGRSPGTPSKSGKRGLSRSTSFNAGCTKGSQEVKFVEGVRVEEVRRGLGIDDSQVQDKTDVKAEEVRVIWEKERLRISRESKACLSNNSPVEFQTFDEAVEDGLAGH